MVKPNSLVVIIGPTGIGKTDLSLNIAEKLSADIISCDSRQMYRELQIGTAAPTQDQLKRINHHFIGNLSIHDYYNASEFEFQTIDKLSELFEKQKYAVMTGGSGLYIDAVVKGIDDLPAIDLDIRNKFLNLLEEKGITHLQELVKEIDPDYYHAADINNAKRLLKALEIQEMTGKPYSTFRTNVIKERPFNIIQIGLQMDRELLYERIDKRVDIMLEDGLIQEAKTFYPHKALNSLNTVGYKELYGHFDGLYDLDEAIRLIKRNSRRYAKRQITWFKRDDSIKWFHPSEESKILQSIEENS